MGFGYHDLGGVTISEGVCEIVLILVGCCKLGCGKDIEVLRKLLGVGVWCGLRMKGKMDQNALQLRYASIEQCE